MKRALLLLVLVVGAWGCGESAQAKAARLAEAEARMEACKKDIGLPGASTPESTAFFEPAAQGRSLTPERMIEMRIKVECMAPLTDLLEARRAVNAKK